MTLSGRRITLHYVALWCTILIPLAAALSRFAADMLIIIICLTFLLHSVWQQRTDWLAQRWFQLVLLLWAYVMLRALFVEDVYESMIRASSWIRFPLFAVALQVWVLQTKRHFSMLLYSLSGAVGFLILDTTLQIFAGKDLLMQAPIPAEMGVRLTGPYSSPIIGIMLIWLAIPCITVWLAHALSQKSRTFLSLCLAVLFSIGTISIIFMSGERMALLLSGLSFVLGFFLMPVCKKKLFTVAAAGAILLILIAYSNPNLVERQVGKTHHVIAEFGASAYGQLWQSAIAISKENPLTGVGLRHFRVRCPEETFGDTDAATLEQRCNLHPHNIYLEWLAESGAIGLGLFIAILALMARHFASAYRDLKTNPLFIGLLITVCIRLWPLASTTSFFAPWSAVPFWLMIGWLLAMCTHKKGLSQC